MNRPLNRRLGGAFGVSAILHVSLAVVAIVMLTTESARAPDDTPPFPTKFVFISTPGSGGGGGGNPTPAPLRQALEIPPHQPSAPVPLTPVVTSPPPEPAPVLDVQVETDAAKILSAAGLSVTALAAPGGDGRGPAAESGRGRGVGPGEEHGFDGASPAGGDVTAPGLVKRVDPRYTSEAMVTKITGCRGARGCGARRRQRGRRARRQSLDAKYGLDRTAIEAAKQWVFKPGIRRGQAVDVIVTLILEFRLH